MDRDTLRLVRVMESIVRDIRRGRVSGTRARRMTKLLENINTNSLPPGVDKEMYEFIDEIKHAIAVIHGADVIEDFMESMTTEPFNEIADSFPDYVDSLSSSYKSSPYPIIHDMITDTDNPAYHENMMKLTQKFFELYPKVEYNEEY